MIIFKKTARKIIFIIFTGLLVSIPAIYYEKLAFPEKIENSKIVIPDSIEIKNLDSFDSLATNFESYINDLDEKNGKDESALLVNLEKAYNFYLSGFYEEALSIFEDSLNKVYAEDNPKIYGKIRTHEAACHIGLAKKKDAIFHMQSAYFSIGEARKALTVEEYPIERAYLLFTLADYNKQLKQTSYNLETIVLSYEESAKLFREHGNQIQYEVALYSLAEAYETLAKQMLLEKEQNNVVASANKEEIIKIFIKAIDTRKLYLSIHKEEDNLFVGMHGLVASDCSNIILLQENNELIKEYMEQCIFSLEEMLRVDKIIAPENEALHKQIEQELENMKSLVSR